MIAEASEAYLSAASGLVQKIEALILFPLIGLLSGAALLVFLWGVFQFVVNADSDEGRETGKRHMLWGVIGMLIMLSAYAILRIATNTFGIDIPEAVVNP